MIEVLSERMPRYNDFIAEFGDVSLEQLRTHFIIQGSRIQLREPW